MLLIQNARHLDARVNLLINNQEIVTMVPAGKHIVPADCQIINADGLMLLPALVDCHVHLREPGFEYKEDIASGLSAAAHGGFGRVLCMANTNPVNDCAPVTQFMLAKAHESHPNGPWLYPIAAATIGLKGEELSPLAELAEAGCIAVSNDGKPVASAEITRRVMEYGADYGLLFIDHCEDPQLAKGWLMHEGEQSGKLGLKGQPGAGEAMQAARDIVLAEELGIPVHLAHVSSRLTVDLIAWAKKRGVPVTAETCPHYLLLDENALANYNTLAKVSPPLRTVEDRAALRHAVKTGVIDILATDHAPHASYEKNTTMDGAPFGISGLDLALPLTFRLVDEGVLDEIDVHRLWARRPAEIFKLPYNDFAPGDSADFILYDPDFIWQATEKEFYSKSANTPFFGETIKGRVRHLWLRGKQIF